MKTLLAFLALAALGLVYRAWPDRAAPGMAVAAHDTASPPSAGDGSGASGPRGLRGEDGRSFFVDKHHPLASDKGPGSRERPWETISRAAGPGVLRPGDVVYIAPGVYREAITPHEGGAGPDRRVTFAALGEPGSVVVTGADPADEGWAPLGGGRWRRAWAGPPLPAYNPDPVFRREMLVRNGEPLRPVARPEALVPGTFYVEGPDTAQVAIIADFGPGWEPGRSGRLEVATRTFLFRPRGPNEHVPCGDPSTPGWFRLSGLTFRHAANRAQWGAVCSGREGALFEDIEVVWTNGRGFDTDGRGHVLRRTRARHNGQTGYGGACVRCLFEQGEAVGNNWKGHDPFWEAGGGKWTGTRETVFRTMRFADNEGPGLWLDGDNADNTVENSYFDRNLVAGIMLELATVRTLVQHNVVTRTRWRAWSGAGILSQAASDNTILHNTVQENEGTGLWLRLDPERRAPDGGNTVHANLIASNATRRGVEARNVAVEGTSPVHVATTRWSGNVYGRKEGDPLFRSTFYLFPVAGSEAGLRSNDLADWERLTGEAGARLAGSPGSAVAAPPPAPLRGGASEAPPRPSPHAGAQNLSPFLPSP